MIFVILHTWSKVVNTFGDHRPTWCAQRTLRKHHGCENVGCAVRTKGGGNLTKKCQPVKDARFFCIILHPDYHQSSANHGAHSTPYFGIAVTL